MTQHSRSSNNNNNNKTSPILLFGRGTTLPINHLLHNRKCKRTSHPLLQQHAKIPSSFLPQTRSKSIDRRLPKNIHDCPSHKQQRQTMTHRRTGSTLPQARPQRVRKIKIGLSREYRPGLRHIASAKNGKQHSVISMCTVRCS